jgi:hypothetical protein
MPNCRICGAVCSELEIRPPEHGGGCVNCSGSPNCGRCGHRRRDHRGAFGSGTNGCAAKVELFDGSLGIGRCACPGYSTDPSTGEIGVADVRVPKLRLPSQ